MAVALCAGLMYQRPAPQSSAVEGAAPAAAPAEASPAKDLLEGDLFTLSQHLTVARRCHTFVTSQDSAPAVAEQQPQEGHPNPQQHQPAHLRCVPFQSLFLWLRPYSDYQEAVVII